MEERNGKVLAKRVERIEMGRNPGARDLRLDGPKMVKAKVGGPTVGLGAPWGWKEKKWFNRGTQGGEVPKGANLSWPKEQLKESSGRWYEIAQRGIYSVGEANTLKKQWRGRPTRWTKERKGFSEKKRSCVTMGKGGRDINT